MNSSTAQSSRPLDFGTAFPQFRNPHSAIHNSALRPNSKLALLKPHQLALVHRWLLDKSLPYQSVAQACLHTFNLHISKSSIARYHDRLSQQHISQKHNDFCEQEEAQLPPVDPNLTPDQCYQSALSYITQWVTDELQRPIEIIDFRTLKEFFQIIIAARREDTQRRLVDLQRDKFERWAAKQVLNHARLIQANPNDPSLLLPCAAGLAQNLRALACQSRKASRTASHSEFDVGHSMFGVRSSSLPSQPLDFPLSEKFFHVDQPPNSRSSLGHKPSRAVAGQVSACNWRRRKQSVSN